MTLSSSTPHKKARIEIIPLIDIMFFLLASFMLVSMSMIKLQKIDTRLPGKVKGPPPTEKQDFTIVAIDAKGDIYYDKDQDPITPQMVIGRLSEVYKVQQGETKVFINCDKDAKYDRMITVLDSVRSIGITKVNFPLKMDNTFDPLKPRPDTHAGKAGAAGAPAAALAPPTVPAAPPATNP